MSEKAYDPDTGEINPGTYSADPDYSPESWAEMPLYDYITCIANYGDDFTSIREVLRNMPRALYAEYADMDYPELPEELRPDYEAPSA